MYVWVVIEGEKWITTAWLREGVTAEENADLYDPEGIRILAGSEYDSNDQETGDLVSYIYIHTYIHTYINTVHTNIHT